ncbi:MAG TPA: hypothetical protein VEN95_02670 [Actinomycetota bacterium]|nr:hypothetical protein [Actinomycetota bacterium]
MIELVLGKEGLGVTSKQPAQHLLARVAHPDSDLAEGGFERLVVAEAAASERLFDRVVEVMGLELSYAPRAVPPNAHCTQHVALANASSKEDGNGLDHWVIFLSHLLVGMRARQTDGHIEPLQGLEGDPHFFAELRERLIQAREAAHCALNVAEGQMSGRQRLGEPVRVYSLCFQFQDDPRSHDVATGKRPTFRLKDAEVRQLSNAFDARARPLGEFVLA